MTIINSSKQSLSLRKVVFHNHKAGLPAYGSTECKTFPAKASGILYFILKYGSGGCDGFTPSSLLISCYRKPYNQLILFLTIRFIIAMVIKNVYSCQSFFFQLYCQYYFWERENDMASKKKLYACLILAFLVLLAALVVKNQNRSEQQLKVAPFSATETAISGTGISEPVTQPAVNSDTVKTDRKSTEPPRSTAKSTENAQKNGKTDSEKKTTVQQTQTPSADKNRTSKKTKAKTPAEKKSKKAAAVTASPAPSSDDRSQVSTPAPTKDTRIHFTIQCKKILDRKDLWKDGIEQVIPKNGIFFDGMLDFEQGSTVYDLLKKICKEQNIPLDSKYTPIYATYYVQGIGNLYEFDCGSESGWKYMVNGELPGVGSSAYLLEAGDQVVFYYDYTL